MKKVSFLFSLVFLILIQSPILRVEETMYASPDEEFLDGELKEKYFDIQKDTIRFVDAQTSKITGLVRSFKNSSVYVWLPEQKEFVAGREPYLDKQAFTYDQATAAMMYVACGMPEKARGVLDPLAKDFYVEKNGHQGLLTSYESDNRSSGRNLMLGYDGDRIHIGPNMWVALACMQYLRIIGDGRYLPLVVTMAKWVSTLVHFPFADGSVGGPSMGYGWGPDWSTVYSTENCIDYYSILSILERVYNQGSPKVKSVFQQAQFGLKEIQNEKAAVERWFKEIAYNKETGGFNSGHNEYGLDKAKALDTVSNSLSVIGPHRLQEWGIDPFRLIAYAEKYLLITDTIDNVAVRGFDFTVPEEIGNERKRLIWLEGTAQMVLAYKIMSRYCTALGDTEKAKLYKEKAVYFAKELDRIAEIATLEFTALPYTSYTPGDTEYLVSYKYEWELPRSAPGRRVSSIASTAWRFFSLTYYNPMMMGRLDFRLPDLLTE